MYKPLIYLVLLLSLFSCTDKQHVDFIVTNAKIYTVDESFSMAEAFAVTNGKFVGVGTSKEIISKFKATNKVDAKGSIIYPGLIDAHCHFYGLGLSMQKVDLTGTKSFEEVLEKIKSFQKDKNSSFITGRGWDQNDWEIKEYPTKEKLDKLFPKIPVAVRRIDGHALLANQAALDLAGINSETKIKGGEIIKKDGKITGVLIDNAMDLVSKIIPKESKKEAIQALKDAEKYCFSYGLTTIDDAGLSRETIELIDSLQLANELKIRIYAMVSVSDKNLKYYIKNGIFKSDRLNVRSFKVYADGALGSRGAALKEPYSDRDGHYGAMVTDSKTLQKIAKTIANSDFQMNTHAIGDSANAFILKTYADVLKSQTNRRWRMEHAQIIAPSDFYYFTEIIPSIQPTHATSDMYWAEDRLGSDRIKNAYAYKKLLEINGKVALGTDFPVEKVNPMLTFYAAVARKDTKGNPDGGFEMENGLTREETLKGMTIWAAYANFEENEKGSIEPGKFADFVIFDQDIMEIDLDKIPNIRVKETWLNGEKISSAILN
ncbi:MAG: amidohydrolase [Flavobacteriaceae bacterium]|nr:amidohydrolase [Flavobacteriaceae bacterium]